MARGRISHIALTVSDLDDGTRSPPVQGKILIARYLIHRIGQKF